MSESSAWSELVELWNTADGVPDLGPFWARHPQLSPAEQERMLAWHAECQRTLAEQGGTPETGTVVWPPPRPDGEVETVSSQEGAEPRSEQTIEFRALAGSLGESRPVHPAPQPVDDPTANPQSEVTLVLEPAAHSTRLGAERAEGTEVGSPDIVLGGRYRLDRLLGEGNYGRVWLGFDLQLHRRVAIKVPLAKRFVSPADAEQYLVEARTVAGLSHHAHLVSVYDVGRTPEGGVYVVSGYVDGITLQAELRRGLPTIERAVEVLRAVADALRHAHAAGLIHRDVKPANILIETATRVPYLADFGLAVREDDSLAAGPAGSPAYMSPEQAVQQGQPLDGRSDLFSLGIIAFEMFTGRRPFQGRSLSEMIHLIRYQETQPPLELRSDLPAELNRICLKLLQKRPSDRYPSSRELIADLEAWTPRPAVGGQQAVGEPSEAVVTPRGLRAFTQADAEVFLDLLPGLRDREGLPECGSFWKARLEATADTFRVGLVLGPSGSGKSSLLRAGVLPRVNREFAVMWLEATPDRTETDLLQELRNRVPGLPSELTLIDSFRWLRQRAGREGPPKTIVVLDQFEQWLNAQLVEETAPLVQALAHCDGGRLQAVLLVRDDFGVAANRLLRLLDIPLVENQNWRTIDLFGTKHAERVLIRLGRGHAALPHPPEELSDAQREFCRQGVDLLAEKGQVIPVRLALFAELMKRKVWVPETLAAYGGAEGIGVAFLEETLGELCANPRYREFSETMRRMLQTLLPPPGTEIKGHQRLLPELAMAAGLPVDSPAAREAMAILDGELRLITATEAGRDTPGSPARYQLTHDYLVPALRAWLERKQRETIRGRAELLLAERSALWQLKREDRHLPTLSEHLRIRRWTAAHSRRESERRMLSRAAVVHAWGAGLTVLLVLGLVMGGWWFRRQQAERQFARDIASVVDQLETAQPADWARVRAPLSEPRARELTRRELNEIFSRAASGGRPPTVGERIAQLTIGTDRSQLEPLREALLSGPLDEFLPTREPLVPYRKSVTGLLWRELRDERQPRERRLRAGMALAGLDPGDQLVDVVEGGTVPEAWTAGDVSLVVGQLLASNPELQGEMRKALKSVAPLLLEEIERNLVDEQLDRLPRMAAATAIVDYAGGESQRLGRLLLRATPEQVAILQPAFEKVATEQTRGMLAATAATLPANELGTLPRIEFGRQRANAATALLRLGDWEPALKVCDLSDDPEAVTQFMLACRPRGIAVGTLLSCLDRVSEAPPETFPPQVRYALLIALGEYPLSEVPTEERERRIEQVAGWYLDDPSSTVHGAAGWLLRQWGATQRAEEIERTEVKYERGREWYTEVLEVLPEPNNDGVRAEKKRFAMTFIIFPAGEYEIGAVQGDPEKGEFENRHKVRLTRPFAILDREVTYGEVSAFLWYYLLTMQHHEAHSRTAVGSPAWYEAVTYCRWLGEQKGLSEAEQSYKAPDSVDLRDWNVRSIPVSVGFPGIGHWSWGDVDIACRPKPSGRWRQGAWQWSGGEGSRGGACTGLGVTPGSSSVLPGIR